MGQKPTKPLPRRQQEPEQDAQLSGLVPRSTMARAACNTRRALLAHSSHRQRERRVSFNPVLTLLHGQPGAAARAALAPPPPTQTLPALQAGSQADPCAAPGALLDAAGRRPGGHASPGITSVKRRRQALAAPAVVRPLAGPTPHPTPFAHPALLDLCRESSAQCAWSCTWGSTTRPAATRCAGVDATAEARGAAFVFHAAAGAPWCPAQAHATVRLHPWPRA